MIITAFGESLSVDEWAARSGIKASTIIGRIFRSGWSPEDAVSKPVVIPGQWKPEHAMVLSGAAAGERAHETAQRLGWTEERVLRKRKQAIRVLEARNLMNAVAVSVRDRKVEF